MFSKLFLASRSTRAQIYSVGANEGIFHKYTNKFVHKINYLSACVIIDNYLYACLEQMWQTLTNKPLNVLVSKAHAAEWAIFLDGHF